MSAKNLIRWAGLPAMVAGICFVALGLLHPPNIYSSITTSRWAITHDFAIAMSMFGLLGITGIYARQAEAAGWLGLAGFLMMGSWMAITLPLTFIEAFVLPQLATEAPAYAESFMGIFTKIAGPIDVGILAGFLAVADILFLVGGLVFGISTLRAGILSRWAAGLYTVGVASAPVIGLLATAVQPLVTVPIGLGLAWLGFSLWSERREPAAQTAPGAGLAQLRKAGAD